MLLLKCDSLRRKHKQTLRRELKAMRKCVSIRKAMNPLLCISATKRMLAHAFAWSKTIKNIQKSGRKYLFHNAH